jgi:hypothetical protein
MGKAQDSYSIDDLQSDAGHLGHLVDTIADLVTQECPFVVPEGTAPGTRFPAMDRLNALVWILRDQAEVLSANIERHYLSIASSRGKALPSQDAGVAALFVEFIAARDATDEAAKVSDQAAQPKLAEFRDVRTRLLAKEPATATDLAMQFIADTDDGESDVSDELMSRMRALAVMVAS